MAMADYPPVAIGLNGADQSNQAAGTEQPQARVEGGEGREKRSRDRYGRERGQRGDRPPRDPGDERQGDRQPRELQQALEGFTPPSAPDAAPLLVQPAAPATVTLAARPEPAPAATAGLPKVQPFVLPINDLAQVAQTSGLNWVNSDPEKIGAAQTAMAAQPKTIHVPRERQAPVATDEGPLVLVETKRDLRNLTLPFEQTATH